MRPSPLLFSFLVLLPTAASGQGVCLFVSHDVGDAPQRLRHGDLDGDGDADLVTVDKSSHTVSVLLGDGAGGFAPAVSHPVQSDFPTQFNSPELLELADVDNDGRLDVVAASKPHQRAAVLQGDGSGGFFPPTYPYVGVQREDFLVGDLDGDGIADLAWTYPAGRVVGIAHGDGSASFGTPVELCVDGPTVPDQSCPVSNGPGGLAAGDLDGDGALDLLTASRFAGTVSVLLADGSGGFGPGTVHVGPSQPRDLRLADVTGDGAMDVLTLSWSSAFATVMAGDGSGGLAAPSSLGGVYGSWGELADMDGDGHLDLVKSAFSHGVRVRYGDGAGHFFTYDDALTDGSPIDGVAVDLDGDGALDLATVSQHSDSVSVLMSHDSPSTSATQLDMDVWVDLASPSGGAPSATKIGVLQVAPVHPSGTTCNSKPNERIEMGFFLYPQHAQLDACYDFRWVNVQTRYLTQGTEHTADPVLGLLPAIDPSPGYPLAGSLPNGVTDDRPYYWDDGNWFESELGTQPGVDALLHVEGVSSRFRDVVCDGSDASELAFHTWLVAESKGSGTIPEKHFLVLAGFAWTYRNDPPSLTRCGFLTPDVTGIQSALAKGQQVGYPGHPGYPGWVPTAGHWMWACPPFFTTPDSVSAGSGGAIEMAIRPGTGYQMMQGGHYDPDVFFVLGSMSGTMPGLPLAGGATLPLNADPYLLFLATTGPALGLLGGLDANGHAQRTLPVPAGLLAGAAGATMHHAALVLDAATFDVELVSEPRAVALLP